MQHDAAKAMSRNKQPIFSLEERMKFGRFGLREVADLANISLRKIYGDVALGVLPTFTRNREFESANREISGPFHPAQGKSAGPHEGAKAFAVDLPLWNQRLTLAPIGRRRPQNRLY